MGTPVIIQVKRSELRVGDILVPKTKASKQVKILDMIPGLGGSLNFPCLLLEDSTGELYNHDTTFDSNVTYTIIREQFNGS